MTDDSRFTPGPDGAPEEPGLDELFSASDESPMNTGDQGAEGDCDAVQPAARTGHASDGGRSRDRSGSVRTRFWRFARRPLVLVTTAVVAVGLIAWGVVAAVSGPDTYRINAVFTALPGVYSGNAVKVLGVRVGSVSRVSPGPDGVRVTMQIDRGVKLPAGAKAYLMAPNVVNDRFLEVDPAYTSGPALARGSTIGLTDTVTPQSVDDIIANLNQLSVELGPQGANTNGALSDTLHAIAVTLGGSGSSVHDTIDSLGKAFGAVSTNASDVTALLNNLGGLTHAAAGVSTEYEQLAANLAQVSSTLADDHVAIGGVLQNLGSMLTRLNTFVTDNKSQLKGTLQSLSTVAAAVGGQQQALATSLNLAPLAMQNVGRTIDANGNVRSRIDQSTPPPLTQQICGDSTLRLLLVSLDQAENHDPVMDTACGVNQLLQNLGAPPGAPSGANFTRSGLQGGS